MYELLIDKVIGEDWWEKYSGFSEEVSAAYVRNKLAAFPTGETELQITIDSPGGDWYEGVTIFNIIRDFARNHPDVTITTYIQGMAASMASVIALAANAVNPDQNKIVAEDNSMYMIHNSWGVRIGGAKEMSEAMGWFQKVDDTMNFIYSRRSGKSDTEIKEMMDAETWLFGEEILKAGFVDSIKEMDEDLKKDIESGLAQAAGRDFCLVNAKAKFSKAQEMLQTMQLKKDKDIPQHNYAAAALALDIKGGSPSNIASRAKTSEAQSNKGAVMTAEELKKNHADVYAAVMADGEKAGVEKEKARVNRLLAMGKKSGATDYALECIEKGADPTNDSVVDAFFEKGVAAKALTAQAADETVPEVNPPKNDKNADKDAVMAAFDRETGADKWEK